MPKAQVNNPTIIINTLRRKVRAQGIPETAGKARIPYNNVWTFVNKTKDPSLSSVTKMATACGFTLTLKPR